MIYVCDGTVKVFEFTGQNWIECGKFLELPELQALHVYDDIETLEKSIQKTTRPYQLHCGSCLVCRWPSKRAVPFRSRAETSYSDQMRAIPCIVEDANKVIRAFQYNRPSDFIEIMNYLGSWRYFKSGHDENGDPVFFIYNPSDISNGCNVARTDWILFTRENSLRTLLRHMPDKLFQLEYDQVGHIITKRKDNLLTSVLSSVASSMDSLLTIPEITGGFAPGVIYDVTAQTLSLLGQIAKIVESKTKYIALQYNSPKIVDAVKAIYPMLNFVEDVYYRDWPTFAILMGSIPAGAIKRDEWIIFEPSSPDNPKFKIISNEEYLEQYRISK